MESLLFEPFPEIPSCLPSMMLFPPHSFMADSEFVRNFEFLDERNLERLSVSLDWGSLDSNSSSYSSFSHRFFFIPSPQTDMTVQPFQIEGGKVAVSVPPPPSPNCDSSPSSCCSQKDNEYLHYPESCETPTQSEMSKLPSNIIIKQEPIESTGETAAAMVAAVVAAAAAAAAAHHCHMVTPNHPKLPSNITIKQEPVMPHIKQEPGCQQQVHVKQEAEAEEPKLKRKCTLIKKQAMSSPSSSSLSSYSESSPSTPTSASSSSCSDYESPVSCKSPKRCLSNSPKRKRQREDSPPCEVKYQKRDDVFQIPWDKNILKKKPKDGLIELNNVLKQMKIPVKGVVQCPVCHHLLHSATKSDVRDHINNLHIRCLLANCCGTQFFTKKKLEEHKKSKKHRKSAA